MFTQKECAVLRAIVEEEREFAAMSAADDPDGPAGAYILTLGNIGKKIINNKRRRTCHRLSKKLI